MRDVPPNVCSCPGHMHMQHFLTSPARRAVQAQQLGAVQAQQLGDSLHVELQQLRGKAEKAEAKVEAAQEEVDQLKAEIAALVAQRKAGGPPDAELEATIVRKEASRDIANQALTATTNRYVISPNI